MASFRQDDLLDEVFSELRQLSAGSFPCREYYLDDGAINGVQLLKCLVVAHVPVANSRSSAKRQSAYRGKGRAIALRFEECEVVAVIPSGDFLFAADAALFGGVEAQQVEASGEGRFVNPARRRAEGLAGFASTLPP